MTKIIEPALTSAVKVPVLQSDVETRILLKVVGNRGGVSIVARRDDSDRSLVSEYNLTVSDARALAGRLIAFVSRASLQGSSARAEFGVFGDLDDLADSVRSAVSPADDAISECKRLAEAARSALAETLSFIDELNRRGWSAKLVRRESNGPLSFWVDIRREVSL